MKKIIAFLLSLSVFFTLCSGVCFAATLDNGLEYTKYSTYCKITGYSGSGKELVIPALIDGVPVKVIDDSAFCDIWSLTALSDDPLDGDMDIEDSIFSACENLVSIEIPSTITTIGDYAFSGCYSLETVYYTGSSAQWSKISIGTDNEFLTDSDIVYVGIDQVIKAGTLVSDFIETYGDTFECVVNKGDAEASPDSFMSTGMTLTVTYKPLSKAFTKNIVIRGDVNGDGTVKGVDYMKIKRSINNPDLLTGVYFEAGDVNGDGYIKSADYIRIKSYFAGSYDLQ